MNGLSRRNWIVLLALFVWFCSRTMVAVAQTANVVPVPRATLVPATADSFPFLAANRVQEVVDLAKPGYVEEEFVISGTANVYNWSTDGNLTVKTANAPYTTRILVRRPANAAKFSGNVIVEPLENTRRFDWAFLWAISHVPHTPGQAICRNLGYKVPFDWVRLEKMYGSSRNYASKVRQSVDRMLKERWITESDAQRIKAELIAPARTTSNNN